MIAQLFTWAELFVRWLHVLAGIAWIGASFYFIWVENTLDRLSKQRDDAVAGHLWAVHGGGFYYLEKYKTGPTSLPPTLHWFKWEAYTTFLSGMLLMMLVYYINANTWLLLPTADVSTAAGIGLSLLTLVASLVLYVSFSSTPLLKHPILLGIVGLVVLLIIAIALREVFTPRAVMIHLGAMIGTVMVSNVFLVIIPGQKRLVAMVEEGGKPDPEMVKRGSLRSTHNNYLTLPVVFLMISSHYPAVYLGPRWIATLALLIIGSVVLRHALNLRNRNVKYSTWAIASVAILAITALVNVQWTGFGNDTKADFAEVRTVMNNHCVSCHSQNPTDDLFTVAPLGFIIDTDEQIKAKVEIIHQKVVIDRSMPFNNKTTMTAKERATIAAWYQQFKEEN